MNSLFSLLRAARYMLGCSQAEIGTELAIKAKTVHVIESGKFKLLPREALILKVHYQKAGIEFTEPGEGYFSGLRWSSPRMVFEDETQDHFGSRIIRAARGLAGLSQRQLADTADVDPSFIARLEKDRYEALNQAMLRKLEVGLRSQNVEMTPETPSVGAGIRWISDPNGSSK